MEQAIAHGVEDGHEMLVIKFQLGKEEREKQNPMEIKAKVLIGILFCQSRRNRVCDWVLG